MGRTKYLLSNCDKTMIAFFKYLSWLMAMVTLPFWANAQIDTTWIKTYGGNRNDVANDIINTQDSGYLIIGSTSSFGFDNSQMYFLKLDSTGQITWSKSHGGTGQESGNSVIQTKDGGYLAVGYTNSWGAGGFDLLLVKLSANGSLERERYFGGLDWDLAYDVVETDSNYFVIAGETQSFGQGGKDAWIVRYNAITDVFDWNKTIGTNATEDYKALTLDPTGGFYAAGRGVQNGRTDEDVMVTRFNANGDTLWNNFYGDTLQDYANDILWFSDSTVVFTGANFAVDSSKTYTSKIKEDSIIWEEKWINGTLTEGKSILERPDGNPAVFSSLYNSSRRYEFWYIFMGFTGAGTMGSLEDDFASKMILDHHGKYLMLGSTNGFASSYSNILLYKTVNGHYNPLNFSSITDNFNILSTDPISQESNFSIFQDEHFLTIQTSIEHVHAAQVRVFDIQGKVLAVQNLRESTLSINKNQLQAPIVFVQITNGTGEIKTFKLFLY
jgi:hypothetical protein